MPNQTSTYLLSIAVFLFAYFCSYLLLDGYKGLLKKYYNLARLILGVVIIIAVYFLFSYIKKSNDKRLHDQETEIIKNKAKIYNIKQQQDKILQETKRHLELIKRIQNYYRAYCINDLPALDSFYVYPMDWFFAKKNADKKTVHYWSVFEYRNLQYKNCVPNEDRIQIDSIAKDTLEVSILLLSSTKNVKKYTTLLLNKDKKIFSIISTIRTQDFSKPK